MSTGTCSIHSWNDDNDNDEGEPSMGRRVNQRLEEDEATYGDVSRSGRTRGNLRRSQVRSQGVVVMAADENNDDSW